MSTSSCQEDSRITALREVREKELQEEYTKKIQNSLMALISKSDGALYYDRSLKVNRVKCVSNALKLVSEQMEALNG